MHRYVAHALLNVDLEAYLVPGCVRNKDELVKFYRHSVPKRVAIICGVPATLRCPHAQQPTDDRPRPPTRTDVRPDR